MSVNNQLLVCTDLDRTLLPNGEVPESPGVRERFAALAGRPEVTLTYVTGRDRALVEEAIETCGLPLPDFVISDVGTVIYAVGSAAEGQRWEHLQSWEKQLSAWWTADASDSARRALAGVPQFSLQEPERQSRFKLSYYTPLLPDSDEFRQSVHERLRSAGVELEIVYSIDEAANVGLLDLLPPGAGKKAAIEHLLGHAGFARERTLFAGDSGNDLDVLVSSIPAVLVANASAEVREQALCGAREQGNEARLFLAKGGFLEMNGNYGAGILEGIAHYWPWAGEWIR